MIEDWKPIKQSDHILVSNTGKVKSLDRTVFNKGCNAYTKVKGREYKIRVLPNGYARVCIKVDNKFVDRYVHRLVAESFLGDVEGKQINHLDGNKLNNNVSNLEIVTFKQNISHAVKHKLYKNGEQHGHANVSNKTILKMRKDFRNGKSYIDISTKYNISYVKTWRILNNKIYKYIQEEL